MPVRDKMPMNGATLCPHCVTRFKITGTQLAAHQGMVRCGHCLQIFDARTDFTPDQPSPQLELPIADDSGRETEDGVYTTSALAAAETAPPDLVHGETPGLAPHITASVESVDAAQPDNSAMVEPDMADAATDETPLIEESPQPGDTSTENVETGMADPAQTDLTPSFIGSAATDAPQTLQTDAPRPLTLAEQVAIVHDENDILPQRKRRNWPWAVAALLLLLSLLAQVAYLFRVDLAAHWPELKPALVEYCRALNCSIALPQHVDLMSIESSALESDPAHENRIALNALLRNRATYAQAFPSLELTLNDTQDKPLARRTFRPADYLLPAENEKTGLLPNHELNIKLRLDTTDLKPTGYRLVLFYPHHP